MAYDTNPAAVATLQADYPSVNAATFEEAANADLVFGALHPPAMPGMLAALAGKLRAEAVFCSLVPKVKLVTISEKLGGFARLGRMNPNAPGIIGQGFNPVAFAVTMPVVVRQELLNLLKPLGQSPEVEEKLLESYAVISAMGPTYFGFQFAEVEKLANSFGLEGPAAREAMRAMLHGTVDMLFSSNLSREKVLDLVPVRPLAEQEADISAMLQRQIGGMHAKLIS